MWEREKSRPKRGETAGAPALTLQSDGFRRGSVAGGRDQVQVTGNGGALDNEGSGATMVVSDSALLDNQSVGGAQGGEGSENQLLPAA